MLSQLLHHSLQRLSHLLFSALKHARRVERGHEPFTDVQEMLKSGQNMVQILQDTIATSEHGTIDVGHLERRVENAGHSSLPSEGGNDDTAAESSLPSASQEMGNSVLSPLEKRPNPSPKVSEKAVAKAKRKSRPRKIVDRRRRRKTAGGPERLSSEESSEDEGEAANGSGGLSKSSSEDSLSTLSGSTSGEDIDLLDTLSDSSYSSEEDKAHSTAQVKPLETSPSKNSSQAPPTPSSLGEPTPSPRQRPRRNIVLAANFSSTSPVQTSPDVSEAKAKPSASSQMPGSSRGVRRYSDRNRSARASDSAAKSSASVPPVSTASGLDASLECLLSETEFQSAVHSACSLSAEDSYLMAIGMFADWLQSYPVITATCGQVCTNSELLA